MIDVCIYTFYLLDTLQGGEDERRLKKVMNAGETDVKMKDGWVGRRMRQDKKHARDRNEQRMRGRQF